MPVTFSTNNGRDAPLLGDDLEHHLESLDDEYHSPSGRRRTVAERATRLCCMRGESSTHTRSQRVMAILKTVANVRGERG